MASSDLSRPGFSPITSDDHAGYLWIVTILGAVYTGLVAAARLYVKFRVLGPDDYLLVLATGFHVAESATVFVGLSSGLGKANYMTTGVEWSRTGESFLASETLAVVALCLGKCSVVAILLRILSLSSKKLWYICWTLMVINVIWGVGSVIGLVVRCDATKMLTVDDAPSRCPRQLLRWQVITAMDIITETISCCLPWTLVWDLNMNLKIKFQIISSFLLRLPLVALSAVHLHSVAGYPESKMPQLASTESLFFLQITVTWSLISATAPNLRQLLASFDTNFGMGIPPRGEADGNHHAYPLVTIGGSSTKNKQVDVGLSSRGHAHHDWFENEEQPHPKSSLRPDVVRHSVRIHHEGVASDSTAEEERSISRTGSRELIIKKEIQWEVSYETQQGKKRR